MRLLKLTTILLLVTISPCWATDYTADINCQAAWLMEVDEDPITDSSQNSNTGAKVGAPTHATASPPDTYSTGYFEFDGTNDYFNCGSGIDMANWTALTLLCWVHYDSSGGDEHTPISNLPAGLNVASAAIRLEPTNDTMENFVIESPDSIVGGTFDDVAVNVNEWEHIAITWDTTNGLRTYLNGDLDTGSFASSAALDANSSLDLYLGTSPHATGDKLTGKLDEAAIFDRVLNITEINDIMDNGLEGVTAKPQIIFVYD